MKLKKHDILIKYIDGGAELLDTVGPVWNRLRMYHVRISKHFKKDIRGFGWKTRKKYLLDMAKKGKLRIDMVKYGRKYIGYCISSIDEKKQGEIESLYVDARHRNKKIGDKLMKKTLAWMDKYKVKTKHLGVVAGNERAFSFYKRFGFYPYVTKLVQKR
jgi:ribosomal protein S18 acetylase RimI-like enzyme